MRELAQLASASSCTSPRSSSSIGPSGRRVALRAAGARDPSFTASATRCCCAPSCRLRSIWRRDWSAAATMRGAGRAQLVVARRAGRRARPAARSRAASCAARGATWRASSVSTRSSSSVNGASPALRARSTMSPSSSPECASGATRSVRPSCAASSVGSQTCSHALPGHVARGDDRDLLVVRRMRGGSRNGTDAASSSTPSVPVHTSAAASCMLFFSDSASCSSSSSSGIARDMRAPNVCSGSSGAWRSP